MAHIRGIDGLRAIAVLMVLLQHYVFNYYFGTGNESGGIGVSIFFVISGFLITSILLNKKESNQPLRDKFISFYVRRFLRIVPVFYLVIFLGYKFNLYWFTELSSWWHVFYATNIFIFINQHWVGYVGHFWSLDVEEQFYLVWPALMLLTPKKYIIYVISGAFLIGYLFYPMAAIAGMSSKSFYVLPFPHMDTLSAGAILAWMTRENKLKYFSKGAHKFIIYVSFICFSVSYFSSQILNSYGLNIKNTELMYTSLLVLTFVVVSYLKNFESSKLKSFLELAPLAWLGKVR